MEKTYINARFRPEVIVPSLGISPNFEFFTTTDKRGKILYTKDGVRAKVFYKDTYGHRFCELVIDATRLKSYRLEMLDDCSSYINDCRFHYTQKYGVSYDS